MSFTLILHMFKAANENVSSKGMLSLIFLPIFSLFLSFLVKASLNYGEKLKEILQKELFTKSYRFLLSSNNHPVNCFTGISQMSQRLAGWFFKI